MDFDSLKAVGGSGTVKNDYSSAVNTQKRVPEKSVENTNTAKADTNASEGAKITEKSAESGKYNQDELYKGENFQQKMEQAIAEANKVLKPTNKSLAYSVHPETKEIMIKIKDNQTGEVIKEIPSEESLDRVARMRELAGIVIDEKR